MAWELPTKDWRSKYATLKEYYKNEYDPKYFAFNKFETDIDPLETMDDVDAYSVERQAKERIKCALSFSYFCHKYVKITHPMKGLLPFVLFRYQKRCIEEYENNRFCILSKFRQGGLTTVTTIWFLWRCMFKADETIMVVSKSDREAIAAGEVVKRALEELPSWMKPNMSKNNDHQKFFSDTGCKLFFYTPEAARGRAITFVALDEAAFVPQMEKHWKALFPTISTGGKCIVISTVNGVGNWYYDVFMGAKKKEGFGSEFNVIELDYFEHPDYDDPEWSRSMKAQLGERGWAQEVLRDFGSSGESYFPSNIVDDLRDHIRKIPVTKMLFPQWNNPGEAKELNVKDLDKWERGSLYIWREPVDGREYIIGVDGSEGMGDDNDNSCFQVIDQVTCEQVAEFYSNITPTHNFTQVLVMVAQSYNNALIIVEAQNTGITILEKLQNEFKYDNLFESTQGTAKKASYGIKTSSANRNPMLEGFKTRIINNALILRSRRLVNEMRGFVWNRNKTRPEAANGFHDDAIMSYCLALYARDQVARSAPASFTSTKAEHFDESFKAEILAQVKQELRKGVSEDWFSHQSDYAALMGEDDDTPVSFEDRPKRKHDALLREFGW